MVRISRSWPFLDVTGRLLTVFCSRFTYYQVYTALGVANMIPIPPSTTHTSREKPSYAPGVGENILGVFLAVPRVVGKNILDVFLATLRLFRTPIYVRTTARSRPSVSPKAAARGGSGGAGANASNTHRIRIRIRGSQPSLRVSPKVPM